MRKLEGIQAPEGTETWKPVKHATLVSALTEAITNHQRTSNDKTMSIQMVAGAGVFVCDKLVFSGDSIVEFAPGTPTFSVRVRGGTRESRLPNGGSTLALLHQQRSKYLIGFLMIQRFGGCQGRGGAR